MVIPERVDRGRPPGVCRRDGLRGARRAAAARGRGIRLSAGRLWTSDGVPDRLDVVRRRLLGRDCRQRGRARVLRRPIRTRGGGLYADLHDPAAVRAARVLTAGRRGACRHRPDVLDPPARCWSRTVRRQPARGIEGVGAADLHRARPHDRRQGPARICSRRPAASRRQHGCLP